MGRIVYSTAATLNGFLADERDSLDWLFAVPGGDGPDPAEVLAQMSVLVSGSTTYEWVLAHEHFVDEPARWHAAYGARPMFVFTTRELPVPDGADVRFVRGTAYRALTAIRDAAGDGDIWIVGGGDLAGQFLDIGALDEIEVMVAPAAVHGGAPLLPRRVPPSRLDLTSARKVGQFAVLRYRVRN
ncbi:dihydrofolate reductase family protein [Rhodococcus sp. HNM0569]|uniref:dihydrofolate reductase family protein n=1 Tax=Rhodococcus sp. HNM0569 TaxID=2716340 RepID=UPI001469F09A|nr:dihydrofolate reductase family protein [Rhodococcus sp. HNM0569]NLU82454.1 dihydrofolate reductase [Rhodococcus sp. HNM0569]